MHFAVLLHGIFNHLYFKLNINKDNCSQMSFDSCNNSNSAIPNDQDDKMKRSIVDDGDREFPKEKESFSQAAFYLESSSVSCTYTVRKMKDLKP